MAAVRFGIIACSSVARRRFVPALKASALASPERIGSRQPVRAEEFARSFGVAKAGTYEAVLEDKDVDAIYISTPITQHEEWVEKAVQHGKHVLCEKPAFMNYHTAARLVRLCREKNVRLMEGYSFRHHPQHALVRSLIREGRIGAPRFVHCEFTYPRPSGSDIRLNPELGGGVFFDAGGYPVAAARMLLAAASTTVISQVSFETPGGLDNGVAIALQFAGGETAHAVSGFGLHYRSRYSVLGTKGRLEVERAFSVLPDHRATVRLETEAGTEVFTVEPADQFRLMVDDFAAQVTGGAAEPKDWEKELLQQHAVMDAAWRSHHEQRLVNLSEYSL